MKRCIVLRHLSETDENGASEHNGDEPVAKRPCKGFLVCQLFIFRVFSALNKLGVVATFFK